jgi:hypothetical protein
MINAQSVVAAVREWQQPSETGDIFLFLEPIHPFEADDSVVLNDLRESVRHWRAALDQ